MTTKTIEYKILKENKNCRPKVAAITTTQTGKGYHMSITISR